MASNLFGRYVWLIDIIRRHKKLTFEQINNLWKKSGLSYGEEDDLALRTFHNHRKAIADIFDVYIEVTQKPPYTYFIDNPERLENDGLRSWLIDSYATLNQVHADEKLRDRIQFDYIPSGNQFLTAIVEAMRKNSVIKIAHQGFTKDHPSTFEIEPYLVKVVNRRWYVIARSPYYDDIRSFGLDRISNVEETNKKYKMPKDFDVNKFFEGCCGIINDQSIPVEKVVVRAYWYARKYLKTLPIHSSQTIISEDDEQTTFEYQVRPTYDFLQGILSQVDQVEVLEPQWVCEEIQRMAQNILNYYKK